MLSRKPFYNKTKSLNVVKFIIIFKRIDEDLSKGLIKKSCICYTVPLILVVKPNSGIKIC